MPLARALFASAALFLGARAAAPDQVEVLPGYGVPDQKTFAGYVEVNASSNGHLFYMLFEKESQAPARPAPLLVWLNGGPGASSSLGNFLEHGPYRLQANGSLTKNPSTWTSLASVVYFDQPVGTGYSYCDETGYVTNMPQLAEQFATGLLHFFDMHPELKASPLYLTGESYAGVYVPAIAAHILKAVPQLKLQGVFIGNPGNFHYTQYYGQIEFAASHALIDEAQRAVAEGMWNICDGLVKQGDVVTAFQKCEAMSSYIYDKAGNPFLYNVEQWGDIYDDILAPIMEKYFADPVVKQALHAGDQDWKNGDGTSAPNPVVIALNKTLMDSVIPDLETILEHKLPLGVFDGVLDGSSCNHISVYNSLKLLSWAGKDAFFAAPREQWKLPGVKHPAGYTKQGGGLTFVWVSNSGHLVPTDQPEAGLDMLRNFLVQTGGLGEATDTEFVV